MVGISKQGTINKKEFMAHLVVTNVVAWIENQSNMSKWK
jgi:hypothetical protein